MKPKKKMVCLPIEEVQHLIIRFDTWIEEQENELRHLRKGWEEIKQKVRKHGNNKTPPRKL